MSGRSREHVGCFFVDPVLIQISYISKDICVPESIAKSSRYGQPGQLQGQTHGNIVRQGLVRNHVLIQKIVVNARSRECAS